MRKLLSILSLFVLFFSQCIPAFAYVDTGDDFVEEVDSEIVTDVESVTDVEDPVVNEIEDVSADIEELDFLKSDNGEGLQLQGNGSKETMLITGSDFSYAIKKLANPSFQESDYYDDSIKYIIRATDDNTNATTILSVEGSEYPVKAWFENDGGTGIIYYYTEADTIYLNPNSNFMFAYMRALKTVDLTEFDSTYVEKLSYMFYYDASLEYLDFSEFNTPNLKEMGSIIRYSTTITGIDLSSFDTSHVTYMTDLFEGCTALETVIIDNWDFSSSSSLSSLGQGIFASNTNLKSVSARNWKNLPESIDRVGNDFFGYSMSGSLDVTNWDTSNVTTMQYAFYYLQKVTEIKGLETWDTSNVTTMYSMFKDSKNIKRLNLSGWNTVKVENMESMFEGCEGIEEIIGLNTWNTCNVKKMGCMFYNCKNLKYLNLDNWDLRNLRSYSNNINFAEGGSSMVYKDNSLKSISARNWKVPEDLYNWISYWGIKYVPLETLDVSNWDTSNVTKMNFMFTDITSEITIIGLETWDTSNVDNMRGMFTRSTGLTGLDLSSFDTNNVTDMFMMFQGASNLETVYVGNNFNTDNVTSSENMFSGAISLVGGKGTTYDENHIDKEYARVDGVNSGYFTQGEFDIVYNLDGGELENKKTSYRIGESFTIGEPTRNEAVFMGWTGSNGDVLQKEVIIQKGTTGDLEYTANWKINQYKIIFDTNGGNEINPIEKDYNSLLSGITLPIPTRECNEFSGWDIELPEIMPAHDITLKAVWNYTCSKSSGGGGTKKTETITRETAVETPTENEHNSADEKKSDIPETSNTPANEETTSNQVISVTQEVSEDGTIEAVVETIKIKNTDIVAIVRTEVNSTNSASSSSSSATHTKEENDAYSFAKSNGITTTSSIDDAKMNTELTRIQMAKMLSNFAINVLGQEPDPEKGIVKFDDVTNKMDKQYDNAVTKAYQLGIMGQNVKNNEFRPNDTVTRAEFASALSRLLYHTEEGNYKGTGKYYVPHVAKLYNEGIINKADPKIKEKRGYVMTMLKRTVE